jgi:prolycopene isomerase
MLGQDLMRRPHAETRWSNLLLCGESTTMGTGTPAVVVSGLSAADVILRREGLPECRYFKDRGYVRYLSAPAPPYPQEGFRQRGNLCLWCEKDTCRTACPWEMDIRGILRRLYSDNVEGARRLLKYADDGSGRLACLICKDKPCLKACNKIKVLGTAVPISEVLEEVAEHR